MVIVNADDFGESRQANKGIIACFDAGVITNTTILANMPGFEEAVQLAHEHKIASRVGLHINIMDGPPLTNKIRFMPRFCNSHGIFSFQRLKNFRFSKEERLALWDEVASQIEKCRASGLSISHADSHLHVHTEIPVFRIIAPVLKFYGIRNMRIASNIHKSSYQKKVYKSFFNHYLRFKGFSSTDYFGDMEEFKLFKKKRRTNGYNVELMVHPYVNDNGEIIDVLDRKLLIERLQSLINGYELGTYPLSGTSKSKES